MHTHMNMHTHIHTHAFAHAHALYVHVHPKLDLNRLMRTSRPCETYVMMPVQSKSRLPLTHAQGTQGDTHIHIYIPQNAPYIHTCAHACTASVVSSVVSREQTVSSCGLQSIMSAMRRSGPGHNARLLKAVQVRMRAVDDCDRAHDPDPNPDPEHEVS